MSKLYNIQTISEFDLLHDLEYLLSSVPSPLSSDDELDAYLITLQDCRRFLYDHLKVFCKKHE